MHQKQFEQQQHQQQRQQHHGQRQAATKITTHLHKQKLLSQIVDPACTTALHKTALKQKVRMGCTRLPPKRKFGRATQDYPQTAALHKTTPQQKELQTYSVSPTVRYTQQALLATSKDDPQSSTRQQQRQQQQQQRQQHLH